MNSTQNAPVGHSPPPWEADGRHIYMDNSSGFIVTHVVGMANEAVDRANLAVNSHPALLARVARLEAALKAVIDAVPFPSLSASGAQALAFEIEQGAEAKYTTTQTAKVVWLRDIAHKLDRLADACIENHPAALAEGLTP